MSDYIVEMKGISKVEVAILKTGLATSSDPAIAIFENNKNRNATVRRIRMAPDTRGTTN